MGEPASVTLLAIGVPVSFLFSGAVLLFFKVKNFASLLQLLGACCLMMVVFVHLAEAFRLLSGMGFPIAQVIMLIS